VVRLRNDPGDAHFVRPRGFTPVGAEHRFFTKAGKYTGLFWEVTTDQAAVGLQELEVISVKEFKERAERRGFVGERAVAGSPDPRDLGPDRVLLGNEATSDLAELRPVSP
jgi:hypothetical protein